MSLIDASIDEQFDDEATDELIQAKDEELEELNCQETIDEIKGLLNRQKRADMMVTTLLTAFRPQSNGSVGALAEETGWEIRGADLSLPNVSGSADVVLFSTDEGVGMIICLSAFEQLTNRLSALDELLQQATEDTSSLERRLTGAGRVSIDETAIYPILCIHGDELDKLLSSSGGVSWGSEQVNPWMWKISLSDSQSIGAIIDDRLPDPTHTPRSSNLVEALGEDVSVDLSGDTTPDLYPTSDRLSEATQLVKHLVKQRREDDDDAPLYYFDQSTAIEYYEDTETIAENEQSQLGEEQALDVINWWIEKGIVDDLSASDSELSSADVHCRFDLRKTNPGKIMREVEEETRSALINEQLERRAKRNVLNGNL